MSTLPGQFETFFTRSKSRVSPEVLQALATILKALFEEEPTLERPSDREHAQAQKRRIARAERGVKTRRKNQKKKKRLAKSTPKRKAKRK